MSRSLASLENKADPLFISQTVDILNKVLLRVATAVLLNRVVTATDRVAQFAVYSHLQTGS